MLFRYAEVKDLVEQFAKRGRHLALRRSVLRKISAASAKNGPWRLPSYGKAMAPFVAKHGDWKVTLPLWINDQRNQMTGPADDAKLVVKMINSGAPGVMLDLEDSLANRPDCVQRGLTNAIAALEGSLTYEDENGVPLGIPPLPVLPEFRGGTEQIDASLPKGWEKHAFPKPVIFIRPRGIHITERVTFEDGTELTLPAALHDVICIAMNVDVKKLRHPLCFYIPKSEAALEALWWRDLFRELSYHLGLPTDWIKCMALVESHPVAYEMDEFIYNLRDHILGLNLGRWDYMASLIHWTLPDPTWVLPDRNRIPHDVPFFQQLRHLLVWTCHRRGIFAIGGMTALFPNRKDPIANERALEALRNDKANEAALGFDGAWTGHPDQNEIAVGAFPAPNQLSAGLLLMHASPDLRTKPDQVRGQYTLEGTRIAIKTAIRYRHGVLRGKGATLISGYMEDLATDRIYRLMIAQRMKHWEAMAAKGLWDADEWSRLLPDESFVLGDHSVQFITGLFELISDEIIGEAGMWNDTEQVLLIKRAAHETLESILKERFDPQ